MKLFTWKADARDYYNQPEEKEQREEKLAEVKENLSKIMAKDFEGCTVEDLMHELAYLRMETELFQAGQMIIDHWPLENKDFAIGEFAYQYFGIFCYLEKRYKEAAQWFLKILKDHEGYNSTYYSWLACTYAEMGQHDKAIQYIQAINAADLASGRTKHYHAYDFGRYYLSIGMYEEALAEFNDYQNEREIVERSFYINKSNCLRQLERYDEAREFLETGYKRWNRDEEIEVHLAIMVLEDLGDYERALGLLLKSFNITKGYAHESWKAWNAQVASNISKLYAERSDWENAYAYLRESIHWSDELLNKPSLLDMIDNRPNAEEDIPAVVYVTICNFIESAFAASPTASDTAEENPYLLDTDTDQTLQNLTDLDTISPN